VAINYDYAVQADSATKDGDNEMVVPPSTIAIQTPTVVVDKNARAHCVEGIAKAFVNYLHTPDAQDVFQSVGLERPIDAKAAQKGTDEEPAVQDYFTADDIGGWGELEKDTVFGPNGAFTTAFENAQG
jgi:ABC-type sulfate transport system substrate-binding protein